MDANSTVSRQLTALDELAERFLADQLELDPILATNIGVPGHEHRLPDLSPAGHAARAALICRTLSALDDVDVVDDVDRVTRAALIERLTVAADVSALGADLSLLNNLASPVQGLREVFDLMPTETADDWSVIAARLAAVPEAITGYVESLRLAAAAGDVAPIRQVRACIDQCADNLGVDGFFATFVAGAPIEVSPDLAHASAAAQEGYRALGAFLTDELLPRAPEIDAVGPERYAVFSRDFLGAEVDLAETYQWGLAEVARIGGLLVETAGQIVPGGTVAEAVASLDADPARKLAGTEALAAWMQQRSDACIADLADTHFDIPAPIRRLECRIAPTNGAGIYYTGPSEDFSRPGRMWWSVPAGVTEFSTWRELTSVHHEGVPGHHLQIGQTVYRRELLNRWRRLACWVSGSGEGWALYAEWLMAELGYLDDPGDRLGLLDGQSLRAVRVVIDIGVHCRFEAPAVVGGGEWTYDKAWQFLRTHASGDEKTLRWELDRYLGWPGQAPSYKIGERLWLQLRAESQARDGAAFDLKAFHRRALDVGSVGLDVLRAAMLSEL
jgi:uncharacterized protein (DUF885 family)